MKGKIKNITIKVKKETTLPDGSYIGNMTSDIIEIEYKGLKYNILCDQGYRGINLRAIVRIKDGHGDYELINN